MPVDRACAGRWLAILAAGIFAANILYFFVLKGDGSRDGNPLTDQVVALHDHGTTFFVTPVQYGVWLGSLIVAGVLFVTGAVLFQKGMTRRGRTPVRRPR